MSAILFGLRWSTFSLLSLPIKEPGHLEQSEGSIRESGERRVPKNELLRRQRILRNWRQRDLAEQLGTTIVTIQRWERGIQQPSSYYRIKLCTLFGLSPQELGLEEISPLPDTSPDAEATETASSEEQGLWIVPYARNPHFSGREELLEALGQRLGTPSLVRAMGITQVALIQLHAIKGLGGIGKTQIAIEYAYRSLEKGQYAHTLWINASSEDTLQTGFLDLISFLPELAATRETNQRKLVAACIRWLEQCTQPWLLIFDNADDPSFLASYLPQRGNGHILFTTRASAVGSLASSVEVDVLGLIEGTHLLLRRAQLYATATEDQINDATSIVIALGQFPLALDQAGAYIEETGCGLHNYLQIYQEHQYDLLERRGMQAMFYPASVATTWSLSFQRIEQRNPAAAELLQLCAFLAPDHIPEELLVEGAPYWPPALQEAVADAFTFNNLLETLLAFSLIKRLSQDRLLSLHRLVQVVQMEQLSISEQIQWARRVVIVVQKLFPYDEANEASYWPLCLRYLEQAQASDMLIQHYQLTFPEAADLLDRIGVYLRERSLFSLAEPLLRRALAMREPDSLPGAYSLQNLAALFWRQGKYTQVEPLLQKSLHICEQQLPPEHSDIASLLNDLALLYFEQGKYAQAEPLYLRSLRIEEECSRQTGIMIVINNLALLYKRLGRLSQAEQYFLRAVHIRRQQLGPEHPLVATALHNLASLLMDRGKYAEAETLFRQALHIYEQELGADHPKAATSLVYIAILSYERGEDDVAEQLCQRALRIYKDQLGGDHAFTGFPLHWLALVAIRQGRYAEARHLDQQALLLWKKQLGFEHSYIAYALHGLALLHARRGQEKQAVALFERTLRIYERQMETLGLDMAKVLCDFADFQRTSDRSSEAVHLYQRALTILEQVADADFPLTLKIRKCLQLLSLAENVGQHEQ